MPPKRTQLSLDVTDRLLQMGFSDAFARLVGEQLNTDFTARQMLGYLRDAHPQTMEEVADETTNISTYAIVKPGTDIANITDCLVLTGFTPAKGGK